MEFDFQPCILAQQKALLTSFLYSEKQLLIADLT
jgi:hypothetical protein